ncbi:MAG: OmpA family protein [Azonexus sp.]|nr:OmpA family protein [Azonexus sp.]MBP6203219.1 OmpA family protein [Azonexus sp.]
MKLHNILVVVMCAALPAIAYSDDDKVLKGREITESALIEALTPEAGATQTRRMRSIRVGPDVKATPTPVAKQASASLLITFETDSEMLAPQAKSSLDVVARALASDKLADFRFLVEGHADPRGGHEHNMQLSQARAESVVNYLSAKHGISRERLKPEGKGDTELRNTVKIDAAENRRVTIKRIE